MKNVITKKGEIKVNELIYKEIEQNDKEKILCLMDNVINNSGFSIKKQTMINDKYLRNLYQIELN